MSPAGRKLYQGTSDVDPALYLGTVLRRLIGPIDSSPHIFRCPPDANDCILQDDGRGFSMIDSETNHNKRTPLGRAIRTALVAGLCLGAGAAFAQSSDRADDGDGAAASDVESITVTARRREESLQDVPISVTAISGDKLLDVGAEDITYLNQVVPNTTIEVSRGTNSTLSAFIRGIGQQDPVAGFEQGVGIYIDDVYLNRPQAAVLEVYDIERVEVLRGPQGTLYGRNTIGGAIKYVTKRLGDEPRMRIEGTIGNYSQRDLVVSGELPISDTFAIGAAAATFNRDGYGRNLFLEQENYDKDVQALRGSMEWTPSDRFFLRLSGDYLNDTSNPRGGFREIPSLFSGFPVLDDVYDSRSGIQGPNNEQDYGGQLLLEYDLTDEWQFKSITAYRETNSRTSSSPRNSSCPTAARWSPAPPDSSTSTRPRSMSSTCCSPRPAR
jgi:iron complex outermembrane receptor protein